MKAKLFDRVLLRNGMEGHIVEVYTIGDRETGDYELEPHPYREEVGLTVTINESDILKILS